MEWDEVEWDGAEWDDVGWSGVDGDSGVDGMEWDDSLEENDESVPEDGAGVAVHVALIGSSTGSPARALASSSRGCQLKIWDRHETRDG